MAKDDMIEEKDTATKPAKAAQATTEKEVVEEVEMATSELMAPEASTELIQYELTYLLAPTVNDVEQSSVSEHIRKIMEKLGGKIADESIWGKQKLSYPIQGHTMGVYVVLKIQLPGVAVRELENQLKLIETIMRFLLIKKVSEKVKRMQAEKEGVKAPDAMELPKESVDPDMEVLTAERAEQIKQEIKKDLEEKKVTSPEKLKEIDKKLDEILEDDLGNEELDK